MLLRRRELFSKHLTIVSLIPAMTSNTTPSGEVIADSTSSTTGYPYYYAFDGSASTNWESGKVKGTTGAYIGYKFPSTVHLTQLQLGLGSGNSGIMYAYVQTSLDGSTWTTQSDITITLGAGQAITHTINLNEIQCQYFRTYSYSNNGSSYDNRLKSGYNFAYGY